MTSKFKQFAELRNHFSRSWLRFRFRNKSWIHARGGNVSLIAYNLLEPFRPAINEIADYQEKLQRALKNESALDSSGSPSSTTTSTVPKTTMPSTSTAASNNSLYNLLFQHPKDRIFNSWVLLLSTLISKGGTSEQNKIEMYWEGYQFFSELWKAIDQAKQKVFIETYTFEPDETGMKTLSKLEAAAKRGCKVILLVDGFGSSNLKEEHYAPLQQAGGRVFVFNKPLLSKYISSWARNHRKLAVIDDQVGFCGGMNIANKYSGKSFTKEDFDGKSEEEIYFMRRNNFRDTHAKFVGPCVNDLANCFYEVYEECNSKTKYKFIPREWAPAKSVNKVWQWYKKRRDLKRIQKTAHQTNSMAVANGTHVSPATATTSMAPSLESIAPSLNADHSQQGAVISDDDVISVDYEDDDNIEAPFGDGKGIFLQILSSYPRRGRRDLHRAVALAINESRKKCIICTPYFLPSGVIMKAILNAKRQGSDVRILTAGMSDVPMVRLAYMQMYGKFLKHGVRIYEYHGRTLHAKSLTIDGFLSSAGSYNLDRVSYYTNLEVGWLALDTKLSKSIEDQFYEDLKLSKEVTYEEWQKTSWWNRLVGSFLLFLMRLLGP